MTDLANEPLLRVRGLSHRFASTRDERFEASPIQIPNAPLCCPPCIPSARKRCER